MAQGPSLLWPCMNRNTLILGLIGVATVGAVAWLLLSHVGPLRTQTASVGTAEPIKVAALLSLTGVAPAWGENARRAIELAVEETNAAGGINGRPVEMLYEDTGADPKKAVSAYQLVTSVDKVAAVIGPLQQTEDVAVMPVIAETGTPTIVPGYIPLQNRSNVDNPLLIWMDAQVEAARVAQYMYGQGIHTVGVVGTLDSWETTVSDAFVDAFKTAGGTVTEVEIVQPNSNDIRLPVTKIVATKPQAIFLGTYYQFVNATKELHDFEYTGQLYSIEVDNYLAAQSVGWVRDIKFIAPDYYTTDFVKKFKTKYAAAPGLPAGQAYDAANLLFSLLKKSTNKNDVLNEMKNFKQYDGVSGELTVATDGRTALPTALFELKAGEVVRVSALP